MPQRGEIVLARFPFTNQVGTKIRPVLVLVEVPGPYRDFLVMFIFSQRRQAIPMLTLAWSRPTQPLPVRVSKSPQCSKRPKLRRCLRL